MTVERIAVKLAYRDEERLDALTRRLTAMVRDGQLLVNRRGGYGVAKKLDLIAGGVIANPDGFGFLKPDDGGDDLFIPPNEMRAVMHGDRVLVSVAGIDRRGRREAAIAEVLERRRPRLVGRFDERRGMGIVIPDDRRLNQEVLIPNDHRGGASTGQIVIAEITEPPTKERPPLGRVVAVLGEKLTASLIVRVAIESHGLPHDWPIEVTREAERVDPEVSSKDREARVDMRDLPLVTIDGEDARDFDDAVFCEPRKGGGWRLLVARLPMYRITCRSAAALDKEAFDRATSVYFPGFVVPMLPETLSNGICSLNPNWSSACAWSATCRSMRTAKWSSRSSMPRSCARMHA
jgi:ribonuclease R